MLLIAQVTQYLFHNNFLFQTVELIWKCALVEDEDEDEEVVIICSNQAKWSLSLS